MSNILALLQYGQSVWINHIGRDLAVNGSLKQLVAAGLRGGINNWTFLSHIINKTNSYDYPVYESSDAEDGYVSIELLPHPAYDTQRILDAARHLWKEVNRPNLILEFLALRRAFLLFSACLRKALMSM
jgi:transaldolase